MEKPLGVIRVDSGSVILQDVYNTDPEQLGIFWGFSFSDRSAVNEAVLSSHSRTTQFSYTDIEQERREGAWGLGASRAAAQARPIPPAPTSK